MRILHPILIVTYLGLVIGSLAQACNQELYDKIYKQIILKATQYDLNDWEAESKAMQEKHYAIDNLRELCNHQKSTYEDKHD